MRQVGILAAAGIYALENNVERLADDHANAAILARGLAEAGLKVDPVQTNMVFAAVPAESVAPLGRHLQAHGVIALVSPRLRLVTHLDVDRSQVERAVEVFAAFFKLRTATAAD
jgi:threonine aldolase